jgi:DNA-directed RNA polymerase subunit RPC12/RpoP
MLVIILVTLAFALVALVLGVSAYPEHIDIAMYLVGIGFLAALISAYMLFQMRRRLLRLKIELPSITTTIECRKCGFKSVRSFQRGDYIFKEVEPCQKCNEKMLITAIYREVKEKPKESFPF